jgi:hypothetical protein
MSSGYPPFSRSSNSRFGSRFLLTALWSFSICPTKTSPALPKLDISILHMAEQKKTTTCVGWVGGKYVGTKKGFLSQQDD